LGVSETAVSSTATVVAVYGGVQFDTAVVTGTATVTGGVTKAVSASDTADYSAVSPAIVIDDQVSFDGSNWMEVGAGLANPVTFAGGPAYFRSIVTNLGDAPLTGVSIADSHGETLGQTTLAQGETAYSSTATLTAVDAVHELDTASV